MNPPHLARTYIVALLTTALSGLAHAAPQIPATITAPDALTGQTVSAALSAAPRATVLVFLSAKCPCSASHEPVLRALAAEYAPQGFRFVGIHSNADEPADQVRAHFAEASLPFPVLNDPGAKIADVFGAIKTPHVFVVSPRGELLYQGGVDDSHVAAVAKKQYLREALAAIERNRRPDPDQVRALGCVIKRP